MTTSLGYDLMPYEHFQWPGVLPGDARFAAFEDVVNVYAFDWDLAVWWNAMLSEITRVNVQNQRTGFLWDPFADIRGPLGMVGGYDLFMTIVGRLPRTEARCAEQLAAAVRHVIKSNVDARPAAWMVYDATRGVWRGEGEEGVAGIVTDCVTRFGMALGNAVDAARIMLDIVEPDPGSKPEVGSPWTAPDGQQVLPTQADVDWWQEATERRERMTEALKPAKEMARAIPKGKYGVLRSELKLRVGAPATAWDSDMQWLVVKDGVINVEEVYGGKGVTLYPHSPTMMSTMALDVAWADDVRNAGKSEWEAGIEKVLPEDDVRSYLQKRYGAALLGRPGVAGKSMVWQFGVGDTAKSTIQECIAGSRGVFAPYAIVTSADALTERGGKTGAGERFKAYARGKRYVLMSELREGEMLDQAIVKSVTGGETVEGTAKYANAVSYFFTATIFMASNHPPMFPPGDTALVGRIHVVRFSHRLWVRSKNPDEWERASPEHRADEDWSKRVLDSPMERRSIFKWVLDGLESFGREGLGRLPEAMIEAREEFAADADPVGRLVRTLLGTEPDFDGGAWVRIYTDQEWEAEMLYDGDGVAVNRMVKLVNARARELGLVKFGEDGLSNRWEKAALRMIHELGGMRKKAMVDRETRKTGTVFARVRQVGGFDQVGEGTDSGIATGSYKGIPL